MESPERMDHHVRMRLRAAAFRARRVYPGAVGELLSRELLSFEEFGIRLSNDGLVMRVADAIAKAEVPAVVAAPLPIPHEDHSSSAPLIK